MQIQSGAGVRVPAEPVFADFSIGSSEAFVLFDGSRTRSIEGLVINATEEEVGAELERAGLPANVTKTSYSPLVIKWQDKTVLFDAGNGEESFSSSLGERGRLNESLRAANIERDAIDVVVISHFHADHVNGLLLGDGRAAFPQAKILVPQVEWNFWMDDRQRAIALPGRMTDLFLNNRRVFENLHPQVSLFRWGDEILPGVQAVEAPGHSIGHTCFMLRADNERLFVQADLCNDMHLFTKHPEWHGFFDQDPVLAEASRRRLYEMLVNQRVRVHGYHFPFPGLVRIHRAGDGYAVEPDVR